MAFTSDFPSGSDGKESACNAGDLGSIPGLRRPLGEGNGYPLQYSSLENSMEESEKAGLKLNIQKLNCAIWFHHYMANRWGKSGKAETVADFIFLGSKITADSDGSHKIKRHLLLGRKAVIKLDSVLKQSSLCQQRSV